MIQECALSLTVWCAIFAGFSTAQFTKRVGDSCRPISTSQGVCKLFDDCDLNLLRRETPQPEVCAWVGEEVIVCCPEPNQSSRNPAPRPVSSSFGTGLSKTEQKCLEYKDVKSQKATGTIVGGEDVRSVEQYPHAALLGYGNTPTWQCGGTLISDRFILTAAHCLNGNDRSPVTTAHIGFIDKNNRNAFRTLQEFRIIRTYKPPDRKAPRQYADIALLELDRSVEYTKGVIPACLYTDSSFSVRSAQAIGWGDLTSGARAGSDILQRVKLSLTSPDECTQYYPPNRRLPEGIDHRTQFCAGDFGKDTCQGDSGGPLQIHDTNGMARIIGVTSFGQKCGVQPGVYTRISNYIPWIESIVWP